MMEMLMAERGKICTMIQTSSNTSIHRVPTYQSQDHACRRVQFDAIDEDDQRYSGS